MKGEMVWEIPRGREENANTVSKKKR